MIGLSWEGPVVWWNPVEGFRHAFTPERRPRPEQRRETLCGLRVTLIEPDEVDWLLPTCDDCMSAAVVRGRDKEHRREEAGRQLRERFGPEVGG
ncbi:zinc finger protein [Actinopolyspora halophila]|uniref:zinc finger protein n=1 Tax=Actinopolyspora halophila TaxID=1850 RepID=UPI00036C6150|nr:zinc finger protein [Actinopolyspora halophila]